jgi:hypothetical protein
MSETNGNPKDEPTKDRLDRLEASHVRLMTDHEVFVKEHEKWVAEQEREWERQKERWAKYDERCEQDRLRRVELDERLDKLVSGIGELIRRGNGPVPPPTEP